MLKPWCSISIAISSLVAVVAILAYWECLHDIFSLKAEAKLSFITHWYDPIPGMTRKLLLSYYTRDHSVELYDLQAKKAFLKRHPFDDLEEKDFYIGNYVVILTRQLKLVDYADTRTKDYIEQRRQRTFAMIKPDAVAKVGEIIELILSRGFDVSNMKMTQLTASQAQEFYAEHKGRAFFNDLVEYITGGKIIALELVSRDAVGKWREVLGPTDSEEARAQVPNSLRAAYGTDKQQNAAHGSDSAESAQRELNFFFYNRSPTIEERPTTPCQESTCCVVKPHAIKSGNLGAILNAVTKEGFEISALQMFRLDKRQAEEFLEVYKEVLNEYPRMVQQLISGPLVAAEILHPDKNSVQQKFREFVGPMDPITAKELRPHSLRARFGEDKVRNAVHCTDLPEDAPLEIEYFFKILQ